MNMYNTTNARSLFFICGVALFLGAFQFGCTKDNSSSEKSPSVIALIEKLDEGDCVTRIEALIELTKLREAAKPAIPTLIRLLEDDKATIPGAIAAVNMEYITRPEEANSTIRALAASTLGAIGPDAKSAVPSLVIKLRDEQTSVRLASASALANIGYKEDKVLAALSKALDDPSPFVRIEVALAIAALDAANQDSVSIVARFLNDKDPDIRKAAALALGRIKSVRIEVAIPVLVQALRDSHEQVRLSATYSLGIICQDAASVVPALVEKLNDKSPNVRVVAAQALREFGPSAQAAIPALKRALKDPDENVRVNASQALERIKPRRRKEERKSLF